MTVKMTCIFFSLGPLVSRINHNEPQQQQLSMMHFEVRYRRRRPQVINLHRRQVINLHRRQVINLHRRQVINLLEERSSSSILYLQYTQRSTQDGEIPWILSPMERF
jgi:hypothetical protein